MNSGEKDVVMAVNKCPACGSWRTEDYLETNLSTFFFPLPKEISKKVGKEPFRLGICNDCSHIFQRKINPGLLSLIYNELYVHYNLDTSPEFQKVYRERTIDFLRQMVPKDRGQKVLDIGCGEGTYFPFFEYIGCECYGIEPSGKGNIAKEKNPNATVLVESFETCELTAFHSVFDVILMNWVLEHIADPGSFFARLKTFVKPGTKLVIQVPDIWYYMDKNLPLFYVHEHINYFTIQTLRILLERKGFKIVREKHGDCPSILICGEYTGIENTGKVDLAELVERKKKFLKESEELKEKVKKAIAEYEKIIFYGVGLLAFWISECCLNDSDLEKIKLVDDNGYYQGKIVPSFNKELSIFPEGYVVDDTLILISTSPSYHDTIRKRIRDRFRGSYHIATIENSEVVVEPSA